MCANTDTVLASGVFTAHSINSCLLNFCAAQVLLEYVFKQAEGYALYMSICIQQGLHSYYSTLLNVQPIQSTVCRYAS